MMNPIVNTLNRIIIDDEPIEIDYTNIYKYFKHAYILIKKNNNPTPLEFYSAEIDEKLYDNVANNLLLKRVNINILKNESFMQSMTIITKPHLDRFNIFNYDLDKYNVVISILNMEYTKIEPYLEKYSATTFIENIYNTIIINNFFKVTKYNITNLIENMRENNFWINNTVSITNIFKNRSFSFNKSTIKNKDTNKTLEKVEKLNDYINSNNYSYADITAHIKKKKYTIYDSKKITNEDICNLYISINNENDRYLLICYMLITKDYAHLILNNYNLLIMLIPMLNKYIHIFKYLIGYAWIIFYLNESIKKTFIKTSDPFIFDINTASMLPLFPYCHSIPQYNPYSSLLVSNENLGTCNAVAANGTSTYIGGVCDYTTQISQGICNLSEFKENMNIFTTGDMKLDLFENVDFEKIALTGSIMTACIQRYHPLLEIFSSTNNSYEKMLKYYNEYYCNADIDIMVKTSDIFEYFKIVNQLYKQITINICKMNPDNAKPHHVKLVLNKKCNFFVSEKFIQDIDIKTDIDKKKYIKDNINTDPILKEIFNKYYIDLIISPLLDDKTLYPELFDDNIEFGITISKNTELKLVMNYKYNINSAHLLHNLEIFQVKYDDFFGCVSRFHLPCVRAYYNGSNVFMTPSCITAHMTFMNIDYKYFSGARDPIEIINKYRMRGFGTWLSKREIKQYNVYTSETKYWSQLYTYIQNCCGIHLNNSYFRPRLYLEDHYANNNYVDLNNRYIEITNTEIFNYTTSEVNDEMFKRYKYKKNIFDNILIEFKCINSKGYTNEIEKWLIPAYYQCVKKVK